LTGIGYVTIACLLWHFYPGLLQLSSNDQGLLQGPVFVVVVLTAVTFPLRLFTVLLTGLPDATFLGTLGLLAVVGTSLLTYVLARRGFALYGLAFGVTLPPVLSAVGAL